MLASAWRGTSASGYGNTAQAQREEFDQLITTLNDIVEKGSTHMRSVANLDNGIRRYRAMSEILYNFGQNFTSLEDVSGHVQTIQGIRGDIATIFNTLATVYEGEGSIALNQAQVKVSEMMDEALNNVANTQEQAMDQQARHAGDGPGERLVLLMSCEGPGLVAGSSPGFTPSIQGSSPWPRPLQPNRTSSGRRPFTRALSTPPTGGEGDGFIQVR